MEIKIFIQQTEDGSKVVFPIGYNEFAPEYKKFQFFLKDEAHKADFANAYSLQINHEFKVYSLISSEITDYLGRSGSFFAIRVVIPNQKSIDDIQNLLNKIKNRYMEHYQNKSMEALTFNDLTDVIVDSSLNFNNNPFVTQGIEKEAYVFWDKSSFNTYFTQKAASLVKCLYIFDKEKTESVVYERMLPFEEVKQLYRKIEITSNGLLESLKVNDIEINKPNSNTFDLITTTEAKVTYKEINKKNIKVLSSYENSIKLIKAEPKIQIKHESPSNPDSSKPAIIAFSFLFVLISGILGWFLYDEYKNKNVSTQTIPVSTPKIIEETENKNTVVFEEINISNKNEKRYKITSPKDLESFEFINNSRWSYINKNGPNTVVDFSKKNIKEIFESKKIKFNETINNNFITELEKISGKEIPAEIKPKVVETKEEKKKTEPKKIPGIKEKQQESTKSKNKEEIKEFKEGLKDN